MGKYFIQYGVPTPIILPLTYREVRPRYVKRFGDHVKAQVEVNTKTAEYDSALGLGAKPAPVATPKKNGRSK